MVKKIPLFVKSCNTLGPLSAKPTGTSAERRWSQTIPPHGTTHVQRHVYQIIFTLSKDQKYTEASLEPICPHAEEGAIETASVQGREYVSYHVTAQDSRSQLRLNLLGLCVCWRSPACQYNRRRTPLFYFDLTLSCHLSFASVQSSRATLRL